VTYGVFCILQLKGALLLSIILQCFETIRATIAIFEEYVDDDSDLSLFALILAIGLATLPIMQIIWRVSENTT
jgi:hypothetical protein